MKSYKIVFVLVIFYFLIMVTNAESFGSGSQVNLSQVNYIKIGIFSDLHANLPAIKAIMEKFTSEGCSEIYCLGDIIDIGPYPRETLKYLSQYNNIVYINGNHELYNLNGVPKELYGKYEYIAMSLHSDWTRTQLKNFPTQTFSTQPTELYVQLYGTKLYFVHWPLLNSCEQYPYKKVIKTPTSQQLSSLFDGVDADIIFYGHNHQALVKKIDNVTYVNPGSAGVSNNSKVSCCIVTVYENGKYEIQSYQVEYPRSEVLKGFMSKQPLGWRYIWDKYYTY